MAFDSGDSLYPDPPVYRIGLDVMQVQLPKRDTFAGLVEAVSEQVRASIIYTRAPLTFKFSAHRS